MLLRVITKRVWAASGAWICTSIMRSEFKNMLELNFLYVFFSVSNRIDTMKYVFPQVD